VGYGQVGNARGDPSLWCVQDMPGMMGSSRIPSPSPPNSDNHTALGPNTIAYAHPTWHLANISNHCLYERNVRPTRAPGFTPRCADTWPTIAETHATTATTNGNDAETGWLESEGNRWSYGWISHDYRGVSLIWISTTTVTYVKYHFPYSIYP